MLAEHCAGAVQAARLSAAFAAPIGLPFCCAAALPRYRLSATVCSARHRQVVAATPAVSEDARMWCRSCLCA